MKYLRKRKRRRVGPLLVVLLVLALASVSGVTLAKYASQKTTDTIVIPTSFYFTSNFLRPEGESVTYTVYRDANITLLNTDGLNTSNSEIQYTISSTGGTLTDHQPGASANSNGDTRKALGSASHSYTLSGSYGDVVTVTAISAKPYAKTLTASFHFVNPGEDGFYSLSREGYVYTLEIFTGTSPASSVKLEYSNIISDIGRDMPAGWDSGTKTLALEPNAHYVLQFVSEARPTGSVAGSDQKLGDIITIGG